jgi:hypothetical protein
MAPSGRPRETSMLQQDDFIHYSRLRQGALYLADRAADPAERRRHLAAAAEYRARGLGEPWPPFRRAPVLQSVSDHRLAG